MLEFNSASLIFLTLFISVFYHLFSGSNPANKNPCPQSYPVIGNLPGFLHNFHRFHDWVAEMLSQTPSSTIQVNSFLNLSNGICTANPTNIEHLLLSNFHNYVKGSRYHNVLNEFLGQGIFKVDGQAWILQRKIASHEFNTKSLKHFISHVVKCDISNHLMPFLSKACDEDIVIDLQEVLQDFTFNSICSVAFGVDLTCLQYSSFTKAFDDAVEICTSRFMSPIPAVC